MSNGKLRMAPLIAVFIFTLVISGCREKATLTVVNEPRFSDCSGSDQPATNNPSTSDNQLASRLTMTQDDCRVRGSNARGGFDLLYRYEELESALPDNRVFKAVRLRRDEGISDQSCGERHLVTHNNSIQYFRVPANDLIEHLYCCEGTLKLEETATVAIIDITELRVDIRAVVQSIEPGTKPVRLEEILTTDQQQRLLREIDYRSQIKWKQTFEHDGCSRSKPATSCGKQNCLALEWTDSNGSARRHFER